MSSSLPPTLPALSVVLGLPFYRRRRNTDIDTNSDTKTSPTANQYQDDITSEVPTTTVLSFDQRVTNNVARIYARRVINRARLDRERDNLVGNGTHFQSSSLSMDGSCSLLQSNGDGAAAAISSSLQSEPTLSESATDWKDDLLRETLLSIISLKEKADKVKSLTSCDYSTNDVNTSNNLLNLFDTSSSLSSILLNNNNNNKMIAQCESTLESKPAEWSDDIDLVQRRLEFGKEISPLSNTTRLQRWGMACKRIVTLGMLVAPLSVLVPCNVLLGKVSGSGSTTKDESTKSQEQSESALQRCHANLTSKTWNYALWAIESAGPTYIKLVQWASTRNDLFSPEFVGHFSKLQDETRGHTWKETEATLHRAYGPNWRNVLSFDKIIDDGDDDYDSNDSEEGKRLKRKGGKENRERQKRLLARNETKSSGGSGKSSSSSSAPTIPIGSGCVAQVYKARLTKHHGLNPPGTSVAVKVQHPNILEKVCLDFYILNKLASALEYIPYLNLDYLSMKDSVDQFRDCMLPQLDLRVEAHNLQRFRRDFEGETQISFPEPFLGLTSREVLVERFVEVSSYYVHWMCIKVCIRCV